MSETKLSKLVEHDEGRKGSVYQDSLGYWTIGVGHLVDARRGGELPEHIIDALLEWDIEQAKKRLASVAPWATELDEVRYAVLVSMTFNLGSLVGWPIFLGQVYDKKYADAAKNMRNTKWAKQVKSRAERLATMMETGTWPSL